MMESLPAGWIGTLIGAIGMIIAAIATLRKGNTDNTAVLLQGWQQMYDAHEKRIKSYEIRIEGYERRIETYEERIEAYETRISGLVKENTLIEGRLKETEQRVLHLEQIVRKRDEEIAALRKEISQISQSTASQLRRRMPLTKGDDDAETVAKLDRAGHNSIPKDGRD